MHAYSFAITVKIQWCALLEVKYRALSFTRPLKSSKLTTLFFDPLSDNNISYISMTINTGNVIYYLRM